MARTHVFFLLLALTILVIEQTHGCSWPGHCIGAQCNDYNDCADDLICGGGPQTCMVPSYSRRRRRDVIEVMRKLSREENNFLFK